MNLDLKTWALEEKAEHFQYAYEAQKKRADRLVEVLRKVKLAHTESSFDNEQKLINEALEKYGEI